MHVNTVYFVPIMICHHHHQSNVIMICNVTKFKIENYRYIALCQFFVLEQNRQYLQLIS